MVFGQKYVALLVGTSIIIPFGKGEVFLQVKRVTNVLTIQIKQNLANAVVA